MQKRMIKLFLGAYNPLTMEGKIIVDGVLASCYAFLPDHDMAHFGWTPMRWIPGIMQWIFGEDNKSPVYGNIIHDVGRLVLPNVLLYERRSI